MAPESLLHFRNIRCVPSVHGRALYAAEAERAILDWRPEVVAVELPALAEEPYLQAVRALPRIQAICLEPAGQAGSAEPVPILGMTTIDPADSIVAASRRALASGIPVVCIDAYVVGEDAASSGPALADEALLVRGGLDAYYARYLERNAPHESPTAVSLFRERAMARALGALSRRHERVLCVTGMFHWERIKGFLAESPEAEVVAPPAEGAAGGAEVEPPPRAYRIDVHADALSTVLGQWPYLAATYERFRKRRMWDRACGQAAVADLVVEAHRRAGQVPSPVQLTRLAALICRITESRRRFTPRIPDLLLAARGVGGRELARHLMHVACTYPQPEPRGDLPVAVAVRGYEGPPVRQGDRIYVPTAADDLEASEPGTADLLKDIGAAEDFGSTERPPFVCFITCRDENEREDRVARRIVERFDVPSRQAWHSSEFVSGLGAGLDCRRTARDIATLGRTFVRRGRRSGGGCLDQFGGVIIDFRETVTTLSGTSISKDCVHAGPKYWKLGYVQGPTTGDGHQWPFAAYRLLAIIFETTRSTADVQGPWYAEVAGEPNGVEVTARAVFKHAPRGRPLIAMVSASRPPEALRRLARRAGRTLVWRSLRSMADLVEQIPGFHRLVDTGHPDAE